MLVLGTWPKRNKCIYDSVIPPFLHTFVVIKYLYKYLLSFCRKRQEKLLNVLLIFHTLLQCNAHSCFRGSVNCGAPSMEMVFKLPNFYFKSKWLKVLLAWSKMAQLSFGLPVLALEGVLSGP